MSTAIHPKLRSVARARPRPMDALRFLRDQVTAPGLDTDRASWTTALAGVVGR